MQHRVWWRTVLQSASESTSSVHLSTPHDRHRLVQQTHGWWFWCHKSNWTRTATFTNRSHVRGLINFLTLTVWGGPTLYLASLLRYYASFLLDKHIPVVNALDTYFGEFWGRVGVMPFFSNAPLAAAEGRCVRFTTIGQRASIRQCLDRPIENALLWWKLGVK